MNSTVKQKQEENEKLAEQLEELNVSVNERIHIDRVNGMYSPTSTRIVYMIDYLDPFLLAVIYHLTLCKYM